MIAPSTPSAPKPDRGLLPAALRLLVWRRYVAAVRYVIRGGAKRKIFAILGVAIACLWLLPALLSARRSGFPADVILSIGPVMIALMTVVPAILTPKRAAITFTPAEIDTVVPGPFSRRQLVLYRILFYTAPALGLALWGLIFLPSPAGPLVAFFSLFLVFQAIQLLTMNLAALRDVLGSRWIAVNAAVLFALLAVLGWTSYESYRLNPITDIKSLIDFGRGMRSHPLMEAVLTPFAVPAQALVAPNLLAALPFVATMAAVNTLLVATLIRLDRGQIESIVVESQRRTEALERLGKNPGGATLLFRGSAAARRLPMFPHLGGVGPHAWRHALGLYRGIGPLLLTLIAVVIVSATYAGANFTPAGAAKSVLPTTLLIIIGATIFLSGMVRCDFRSDLDHLTTLKTFPISRQRLVIGQLAVSVAVLWSMQLLAILGLILGGGVPVSLALIAAFIALPLNIVAICVDNAVWLIAPDRTGPANRTPGFDPAKIGRQAILGIVRLFAISAVAILAFGPAIVLTWFDVPVPAAAVVAGLILLGLTWPCIMLVGEWFRRFDPAADQPG